MLIWLLDIWSSFQTNCLNSKPLELWISITSFMESVRLSKINEILLRHPSILIGIRRIKFNPSWKVERRFKIINIWVTSWKTKFIHKKERLLWANVKKGTLMKSVLIQRPASIITNWLRRQARKLSNTEINEKVSLN